MWYCVAQVENWWYAGKRSFTSTNCTHLLSLQNDQGWFTLRYTPTIIYTDIHILPEKKEKVVIFASRGASPQLLNAAQNFLSYECHIVINCDIVLRKSKIDGTLGKGVLPVLIVHTCCPSATIKVDLRYIALQQ